MPEVPDSRSAGTNQAARQIPQIEYRTPVCIGKSLPCFYSLESCPALHWRKREAQQVCNRVHSSARMLYAAQHFQTIGLGQLDIEQDQLGQILSLVSHHNYPSMGAMTSSRKLSNLSDRVGPRQMRKASRRRFRTRSRLLFVVNPLADFGLQLLNICFLELLC